MIENENELIASRFYLFNDGTIQLEREKYERNRITRGFNEGIGFN